MLYLTMNEIITSLKDCEQFGNDMLSVTIEYNNFGISENEIAIRTWNKFQGEYLPVGYDCLEEDVYNVLEVIESKLIENFPNVNIRITENVMYHQFEE